VTDNGKLTEKRIQRIVRFAICGSHPIIVPNCFVFGANESDMISITSTGYLWEWEIKRTRSDLYADKRKDRHKHYSGEYGGDLPPDEPVAKPNRFYYVIPDGVVDEGLKAIPDYAGLMVVVPNRWNPNEYDLKRVKAAPMLHNDKPTTGQIERIAKVLTGKYWGARYDLAEARDTIRRYREQLKKGESE